MGKLPNFKQLELNNTSLTHIPRCVFKIKSLESLGLTDANIGVCIPREIEKLENLICLSVGCELRNEIVFPENIIKLQKLRMIFLNEDIKVTNYVEDENRKAVETPLKPELIEYLKSRLFIRGGLDKYFD